jgi:hypothetical protein
VNAGVDHGRCIAIARIDPADDETLAGDIALHVFLEVAIGERGENLSNSPGALGL